jgi:hypothetical protein
MQMMVGVSQCELGNAAADCTCVGSGFQEALPGGS